MEQGLIHVIYGEGRGKTTSAIGLGIRAAGSGLKVGMIQFLKSGSSSEFNVLKKQKAVQNFEVFHFERPFGFFWTLSDEQKMELQKDIDRGFEFIKDSIKNKKFDILIIDEMFGVIENKQIDEDEAYKVIKNKPASMEIVLTGRFPSEKFIELGDYVSKVVQVKHPYEKGILARKGIEY